MKLASIDIDGSIELIDCGKSAGGNDLDAARARHSRLNDVMIVMERDRAELEAALHARVSGLMLVPGVESLTLTLDQMAPNYRVAIMPKAQGATHFLSLEQRVGLEAAIEAEILGAIERRAGNSGNRRWQPNVTAAYRGPASVSLPRRRLQSVWFKTMLWLLAAVILATAYLYLKAPGP